MARVFIEIKLVSFPLLPPRRRLVARAAARDSVPVRIVHNLLKCRGQSFGEGAISQVRYPVRSAADYFSRLGIQTRSLLLRRLKRTISPTTENGSTFPSFAARLMQMSRGTVERTLALIYRSVQGENCYKFSLVRPTCSSCSAR
jgi:hypothetical protein